MLTLMPSSRKVRQQLLAEAGKAPSARTQLYGLFDQVLDFASNAIPFLGVFHRRFHLSDVWPLLRQFRIQLQELLLIIWQLIFRVDCVNRALGLTQCAIDALVRMDYQEIRAFVKAVYRANLNTVGVFTVDTVFANYKCHDTFQSDFKRCAAL
jgi:hypothetical protein